jgi:hypothetical protein
VSDGLEHPDLQGVGAEMRAEWRAETEAATGDAAEHWRHSRTWVDWLALRANAGDRVAVNIGEQRFAGLVEETGSDLIALRALFGRVDIHVAPGLPLTITLVDHPTAGGERPGTGRTFRDALLERDGHEDVTVGTLHDDEGLDGTLYVGADFVSIVAKRGAETVVPLGYVTWASARRM